MAKYIIPGLTEWVFDVMYKSSRTFIQVKMDKVELGAECSQVCK